MARKDGSGYETFEFPVELGRRLRQLREKRGLTQAMLASLMGRTGKNSYSLVSRLECGQTRFPTMALIADYLRACGAGFKDIDDILKKYTAQVPASQKKGAEAVDRLTTGLPGRVRKGILRYDRKRTFAQRWPTRRQVKAAENRPGHKHVTRRVVNSEERVERVRKMFANRFRKQTLENKMYEVLKDMGDEVPAMIRAELCEHGRKVFDILMRTRDSLARRQKQLHKEKENATAVKVAPEALARMADAAEKVYRWLELNNKLDWLPSASELGVLAHTTKVFLTVKADVRLAGEEQEKLLGYGKKLGGARSMIWLEVCRDLEKEGMSADWQTRFFQTWIQQVFDIVVRTEPGEERDRQVEEVVKNQTRLQDRVREMAPGIVKRSQEWKDHVGPPPPGFRY
jgi:transcriptional regulator with XRE-family HTH domain